MSTKAYLASKSRTQGRKSWSIIFRHPRKKDKMGKMGVRVRRGLGTTDDAEADRLVAQMNEILADESFHALASKEKALSLYDKVIVDAFYDEMESLTMDYFKLRDQYLPLPTKEDGYCRMLLLGTTGAGKTTVVRQILGTDPEKDRFPAISTAKTTVHESEYIISPGKYRSVVTFFTEEHVRDSIRESLINAIKELVSSKDEIKAQKLFLEDQDQKFRLSYILGKIKEESEEEFTLDFEPIHEESTEEEDSILVTKSEQAEIEEKLKSYFQQINNLGIKVEKLVYESLELKENPQTEEDQEAFEQLIFETLERYDGEEFHSLVDSVFEEIQDRIAYIKTGELVKSNSGWPKFWYFESEDKPSFMKAVRWFSSNYSGYFGKLLTPIVSGMRTRGPFNPGWNGDSMERLILFDGEGLGHNPNTTSNMPPEVIRKFEQVDSIVLVDNAQAPMLASPYAVLKAVSVSGHYDKLKIIFTHFDNVLGDNLITINDKKTHVANSIDNLLQALEKELGYSVKKSISKVIQENIYFLAYANKKVTDEKVFNFIKDQLKKLFKALDEAIIPPKGSDVELTYDVTNLVLGIRRAASKFEQDWDGYLGLRPQSMVQKAHWQTIRAFTKKLGVEKMDGFKQLQPVSDFWTNVNQNISKFLSNPVSIKPAKADLDDIQNKIAAISRSIESKIFRMGVKRIREEHESQWFSAYNDYYGPGSNKRRVNVIHSIYQDAVPVPDEIPNKVKNEFVKEIANAVVASIQEANSRVMTAIN